MSDKTKIEWTEATWNPITGCSVLSPGCTNCYAMELAGTRLKNHPSRKGLTQPSKAGPVWTGEVRFNAQWLGQPLRWKRPRMIFVCAHGDLFHESVPDEWIDQVFAVMALAPQHTFQVLTKRAERMRAYLTRQGVGLDIADALIKISPNQIFNLAYWPLPNVWLGVSAEDQTRADERIPHLLDTPAAVRWISAEPLLGPVDLTDICTGWHFTNPLTGRRWHETLDEEPPHSDSKGAHIDWVVAGGESGRDARPMHPDWARSLRDQCAAAEVPFFFKQWGEWLPDFEASFGAGFDDDPEQSKFPTCVWDAQRNRWDETNGAWTDSDDWVIADDYWQPEQPMARVGKKRAGDRIEGVQHHAWPSRLPDASAQD